MHEESKMPVTGIKTSRPNRAGIQIAMTEEISGALLRNINVA